MLLAAFAGCARHGLCASPSDCTPSLWPAWLVRTGRFTPGDIIESQALRRVMAESQPEVVFHLAAQAQVVPSYARPQDSFSTNVMGTVAVLEAVRHSAGIRVCVVVTSDKCYAQPGSGLPFLNQILWVVMIPTVPARRLRNWRWQHTVRLTSVVTQPAALQPRGQAMRWVVGTGLGTGLCPIA
ncbi:GDP-mannose 4,6-dehydratase [Rhodoferax sp. AJA081-3]|nr:GDP-mannose 4,6-dehydratase [Rhodoferax sp. AJA081-3]